RQSPQPVAILDHRLRHRRSRDARIHDREGHVTLRHPLWRNLGIVVGVSAALTAAGQGGRVAGILFLVLRILFLLVLAGIAFSVWPQNRAAFGRMPLRRPT